MSTPSDGLDVSHVGIVVRHDEQIVVQERLLIGRKQKSGGHTVYGIHAFRPGIVVLPGANDKEKSLPGRQLIIAVRHRY